jgi:hypothetical protein
VGGVGMIPRIAHFYWGNTILPFLRYATLASFRKFNPSWRIVLHGPQQLSMEKPWASPEQKYEVTGRDYSDALDKLGVEKRTHNMEDFGLSNELPEVIKSDYVRWHLLGEEGGFWSDMDILYQQPADNWLLRIGKVDTGICVHSYHSIGFLFASQQNAFYRYVHGMAKRYVCATQYQGVGASMLNTEFPTVASIRGRFPQCCVYNIPMKTVYPYDSTNISRLFERGRMPADSLGVHWYAGHELAGRYQNRTHEVSRHPDCAIGQLLLKVLG